MAEGWLVGPTTISNAKAAPLHLLVHAPPITNNKLPKLKSNSHLSMAQWPSPAASASASASASAASAPRPVQPSLLVFSGGTAFNGVVEELKNLTTRVAHVLPVSDDGGSTAEIVRVLGGPAVGDIRSRCLRLSDQSTAEALAVRKLLGHRLPLDPQLAKSEWYHIVEGEHSLWKGVSRPYRETILAFLVYFQNEILRRPNESFCFSNGSIGNFFFAGARIFFQSLDAAIFLFSRVSDIPPESLVLPVISTNDRLTLGCELWDGTMIRGQNEISHPTNGSMQPIDKGCSAVPALPSRIKRVFYMSSEGGSSLHEVSNSLLLEFLYNKWFCHNNLLSSSSYMLLTQRASLVLMVWLFHCELEARDASNGNSIFVKTRVRPNKFDPSLDPIQWDPRALGRPILYVLLHCDLILGKKVFPSANTSVLDKLTSVDCIIYAMGSLFTSICPSLVLRGIGEIISLRTCPKVLLLNGTLDRETCGFSASCFVTAVTDALNRRYGDPHNHLENVPSQYINTLLVPKDGEIPLDVERLISQGIADMIVVDSIRDPKVGIVFDPKSLINALADVVGRYMSSRIVKN